MIIPARPHEELEGAYEAFAGIEGADGSPVCVFGDASGSACMFENEADHYLIRAAPKLLAACRAGLRALKIDADHRSEIEDLEAAIAEATQP